MKSGIIKLATAACLVPAVSSCSGDREEERPNILFILSDDHTSQSWGIYGGILAPYAMNDNIRRLADEGCVMENVFCTNSISVPSRASILTGQYSHMNGVYTLDDALSPEQDNIAKRLQEADYQTALIGKWHLKKQPSGFDYFSVFHDQGEYFDPVFKTAEGWKDDFKGTSGTREKGFSTDLVTNKTMEWIRSRDKDKPFAMFCQFKATHEPWHFPERFAGIYDGVEFPEPVNMMEFDRELSGRVFPGQQLENMGYRWKVASETPDKWWTDYPELPFTTEGMDRFEARSAIYQKMVRDYMRCAAAIDDNIGRLLDFLDKEGLSKNTIVVYVSDQGYFLGEHGFFDKRIMYEEPLRMPMVIRYPKEIPAGTRNVDMVLNTDFAALLADYAGTTPPTGNQGVSFRGNLKNKKAEPVRESMYYRYWTQERIRPAHFGIRNERYKLIFFYGNALLSDFDGNEDTLWEFYNLETDPHEDRNAYREPQYANVIARMKAELVQLRRETGDTVETPEIQRIMHDHFR